MCNVSPQPIAPFMQTLLDQSPERFDLDTDGKRIKFKPELATALAALGQLEAAQAWLDNCNNVLHGPAAK